MPRFSGNRTPKPKQGSHFSLSLIRPDMTRRWGSEVKFRHNCVFLFCTKSRVLCIRNPAKFGTRHKKSNRKCNDTFTSCDTSRVTRDTDLFMMKVAEWGWESYQKEILNPFPSLASFLQLFLLSSQRKEFVTRDDFSCQSKSNTDDKSNANSYSWIGCRVTWYLVSHVNSLVSRFLRFLLSFGLVLTINYVCLHLSLCKLITIQS